MERSAGPNPLSPNTPSRIPPYIRITSTVLAATLLAGCAASPTAETAKPPAAKPAENEAVAKLEDRLLFLTKRLLEMEEQLSASREPGGVMTIGPARGQPGTPVRARNADGQLPPVIGRDPAQQFTDHMPGAGLGAGRAPRRDVRALRNDLLPPEEGSDSGKRVGAASAGRTRSGAVPVDGAVAASGSTSAPARVEDVGPPSPFAPPPDAEFRAVVPVGAAIGDAADEEQIALAGAPAPGGPTGTISKEELAETLRELMKEKSFAEDIRGKQLAGFRKDSDFQGSHWFIEDSSGVNRMQIGGRTQVRYTYSNFLDKGNRNGVADTSGTNFDTRSDFGIPRFRINFGGRLLSRDITYYMEFDATSRNRAEGEDGRSGVGDIATIQHAWMNWNVFGSDKDVDEFWRDAVQFRIGQSHTAFGRHETLSHWGGQSSRDFQMIDRNIATIFFRPDRNVGVAFRGMLGGVREGLPADRPGTKGFVEYDFTIANGWNSAGQSFGVDNGGEGADGRGLDKYPALFGRVNFDILKGKYTDLDGKDNYMFGRNQSDIEHHETPAWQVGGSFGWQRIRDQNRPSNNTSLGFFPRPVQDEEEDGDPVPLDKPGSEFYRAGIDTAFKWKGFSVMSEAYVHVSDSIHNPRGRFRNQDQTIFGWYVSTGYFVVPRKWELVLGAAGIHAGSNPFVRGGTRDAGTDGKDNGDTMQFTLGTNWFPFQSQNMKFQADVTYLTNSALNNASAGYVQRGDEGTWMIRGGVQFGF